MPLCNLENKVKVIKKWYEPVKFNYRELPPCKATLIAIHERPKQSQCNVIEGTCRAFSATQSALQLINNTKVRNTLYRDNLANILIKKHTYTQSPPIY